MQVIVDPTLPSYFLLKTTAQSSLREHRCMIAPKENLSICLFSMFCKFSDEQDALGWKRVVKVTSARQRINSPIISMLSHLRYDIFILRSKTPDSTMDRFPSNLSAYNYKILTTRLTFQRFQAGMVDALNAEIALGTVSTVQDAVQWLGYTYLFVRMRMNPFIYGEILI